MPHSIHASYESIYVIRKSCRKVFFIWKSICESSSWNRNLMWEFDDCSAHTHNSTFVTCLPVAQNPSAAGAAYPAFCILHSPYRNLWSWAKNTNLLFNRHSILVVLPRGIIGVGAKPHLEYAVKAVFMGLSSSNPACKREMNCAFFNASSRMLKSTLKTASCTIAKYESCKFLLVPWLIELGYSSSVAVVYRPLPSCF